MFDDGELQVPKNDMTTEFPYKGMEVGRLGMSCCGSMRQLQKLIQGNCFGDTGHKDEWLVDPQAQSVYDTTVLTCIH